MNDKESNKDQTSTQEFLTALLGLGSDSIHVVGERANPAIENGRLWLRRVILILVLWPALLILVSLISPEESVNTLVSSIAIGVPIVAFLALVLKWPLISVSIVAASTKFTVVRRILGGLLFAVFLELAAGIYFSIVPVRNAPELLSLRVLIITAMGVLALSVALLDKKEWRTARTAMWILSIVLALVTVISFLGVDKTKELLTDTKQFVDEQDGDQSVAVRDEFVQKVLLVGEDQCSELVRLDLGPPGENVFEGPSGAKVYWPDGTNGPISMNFGVKGGPVCFTGPVGEIVTVREFSP